MSNRGRLRLVAAIGGALALLAATSLATAATSGPSTRAKAATPVVSAVLVKDIAAARAATAKYVNNLTLAKANGYGIITKMIPTMGYHFMNPAVKGFDLSKPAILVYEHTGSTWQLGAVEWVWPAKPKTAPVPGATYGTFGAGCHYKDGTYVPANAQSACPTTAPGSGAAFNFWHPLLFTMHLWIWYPNPSGTFSGTNALVSLFNNQ